MTDFAAGQQCKLSLQLELQLTNSGFHCVRLLALRLVTTFVSFEATAYLSRFRTMASILRL